MQSQAIPDRKESEVTSPERHEWGSLATRLFATSVLFGLLGSGAEGAMILVRTHLLRQYVNVGVGAVWMKPASNIALLLLVALALTVIARLRPKLMRFSVGAGVLAFVTMLGVLLGSDALHPAATAILAAGVAVQVGRTVHSYPTAADRCITVMTAWTTLFSRSRPSSRHSAEPARSCPSRRDVVIGTGLTLGGLCAGAEGWRRFAERRAIRALPAPAAAGTPNVLLIVLDTVRACSTSLHGYGRPTTPGLERLARRSTVFDHAIATAPWTLPSHAGMFTGRYPHELSADWLSPLDAAHATLAEVLSAQGYLTGGFIANTEYASRASGLARGFVHYEDFPVTPGQVLASSPLGARLANSHTLRNLIGYYELPGRKTAADISRAALRWIDACANRPFFAFLNYYDPHNPYLPPEPHRGQFGRPGRQRDPWLLDRLEHRWTPEEVELERDAYDSAIAHADAQIRWILDELERRGKLNDTLLIVTADHGEEFLEHGVMLHGSSLYLPSIHVPLMIAGPGIPAGRRIATPATLRDLPATVARVLGLNHTFPGATLTRHLDRVGAAESLLSEVSYPGPCPAWFPIAKGGIKSLVCGGKHYIRNGDGSEELFDVVADPWETHNLIGNVEGRAVADELRHRLERMIHPAASENVA